MALLPSSQRASAYPNEIVLYQQVWTWMDLATGAIGSEVSHSVACLGRLSVALANEQAGQPCPSTYSSLRIADEPSSSSQKAPSDENQDIASILGHGATNPSTGTHSRFPHG
jgi:hypothetical protein